MQAGDRIDRYVIERELGSGGFGTVYRARHTFTDRAVALKLLRQDRDNTPQTLDRFLQEARASAAIGSPHIVQVLDAGMADDGRAFLAMELLEGEDLATRIARRGKMSPEDAVRIVRQILAGLGAAHARGIVHRDLKPANIFLASSSEGERAKILDFGISKMRLPGRMDGLTRTGMVLGTPTYMSPEQFRGARDVDGRADLYSLSVILYEMLSGKLPFDAESYESLLLKVMTEPPVPLARVAPDVPAPMSDAIDRGLARDPDARWPSAAELSRALDAALRGESVLPGAPGTGRAAHAATAVHGALQAASTPPTRVWADASALRASGAPAHPSSPGSMPTPEPSARASQPLASVAQGRNGRGRGRIALVAGGSLLAAGLAAAIVVGVLSVIGDGETAQPTYGVAPVAPSDTVTTTGEPTAPAEPPKPPPEDLQQPDDPVDEPADHSPPEEPPRAGQRRGPTKRSGSDAPGSTTDTPGNTADAPGNTTDTPAQPPDAPPERPGLHPSISGVSATVEILSPNIPRDAALQVAQRAARNLEMQHCRRNGQDHEVRVQVHVGLNGALSIVQPDPTRPVSDRVVAQCVARVVRGAGPLRDTTTGGIFYVIANLRGR